MDWIGTKLEEGCMVAEVVNDTVWVMKEVEIFDAVTVEMS